MWVLDHNAGESVWKYVCCIFFPVFWCVFFVFFGVLWQWAIRQCSIEAGGHFFGQHFNQSRNRGWGKEGEGGELLTGEEDMVGTSRVHVE